MSLNTNLDGKVAVVTGAASGIGKAIALTFAEAGAAVAIADLNQDGANAVAEEIRGKGGKAIGVAMDVTNEEAVNQGIDQVAAEFGSVDILDFECRHPDRQSDRELLRFPTGRRCRRFTSTVRSSPPRRRSSTCTRTIAAAS